MKKKIVAPVPCSICGTKVEDKEDFNFCSLCNKLKSSVKFDLINKRNNESDDDFIARREVFKSIRDLYNLFTGKNNPKNYEIIGEYLKLKNYLIHNSDYKTIIQKVEECSSTTEKPKKPNSCSLCGCSIKSKNLCDSCFLLVNYKKLL